MAKQEIHSDVAAQAVAQKSPSARRGFAAATVGLLALALLLMVSAGALGSSGLPVEPNKLIYVHFLVSALAALGTVLLARRWPLLAISALCLGMGTLGMALCATCHHVAPERATDLGRIALLIGIATALAMWLSATLLVGFGLVARIWVAGSLVVLTAAVGMWVLDLAPMAILVAGGLALLVASHILYGLGTVERMQPAREPARAAMAIAAAPFVAAYELTRFALGREAERRHG